MKISGKSLLSSMAVVGAVAVVSSAYATRSKNQVSVPFEKTIMATTEYVLVRSGDVDVTNDAAVIIGKPNTTTITMGTSDNHCGTYYDGMGYTTSTTFNGATMNASFLVLLSGNNSKAARYPTDVYIKTAEPSPGKKLTAMSLYKENAADDGECINTVVDGDGTTLTLTFKKYQVTMD